ncbi:hypothetical protein SCHPADRAFT_905943 [Schizopora paradoxa]|uniref:Formin binding protein n=1 Tax=Schizopora paradoxa TaxID=27342 RepID=A0A0H2RHV5_9AGAM|nr:hypothetical protein SCHPADRAFT_905943 [Schizopora paradoxa]
MASVWTEHRNAEGRTYWFNTTNKESVWEKPDVLKSPFEKALAKTPWKEYFSGGRKYYYHTESKESKWDMPDELLLLLEEVGKDGKAQPTPNPRTPTVMFTQTNPLQGASNPGATDPSLSLAQPLPNGLLGDAMMMNNQVGMHTGGMGHPLGGGMGQNGAMPTPSGILPARPNLPDDPVIPHNGFQTVEEGEKAFTHLLRKAGVDATWTWDQTMRAIITDPLYKALNTLAEKKATWQKYVDGLKQKEQEEKEARLAKIRPAIRNMLKGNPNVFHYTTFQTADKLFAQHPIWQMAKIEVERKMIFEEYVAELNQRELQESRAIRTRSVGKVMALFKKLNIDVLTRWRDAHAMLVNSEEWAMDEDLQNLPSLDILLAFEDYSRVREREYEDQTRKDRVEKRRKERKAREGFKALLQELVDNGKLKAKSKWKDLYPSFKDDERYLNLLGSPGSNPIELFWDLVDRLDQEFDVKVEVVEDAIKRYNDAHPVEDVKGEDTADDQSGGKKTFVFGVDTSEADFKKVATEGGANDKAFSDLSKEDIYEIFKYLHSEAVKKQEQEKRRAERKQRHMQDDLRYALKKLPVPIDINLSYEEAVPLMEELTEYKSLEDESRRAAFAKFVKRQKERMKEREASEDGGSTTSRRRKEPSDKHRDGERDRSRDHRDRDRDADYDRDDRDKDRSSRHHHRSGHDADYDSRRSERDYRDRDRDRDRDYTRDRDGYRSRRDYDARDRDRGRDKERDYRDRDDRDDRRRRGSHGVPSDRDWEDPRHTVAHEGGEKREREKSEFSDRSEKRPRYDAETESRRSAPQREETPEEGEI